MDTKLFMTEELKKTIEEESIKLPKETREAISSFDWANEVKKIGEDNLLVDDEITYLQTETFLVLIGLTDYDSFASQIENIGTSNKTAEKIKEEISEKVFSPIAEKITEGVKNKMKDKDLDWQQGVAFVLSNGDYSVFLRKNQEDKI